MYKIFYDYSIENDLTFKDSSDKQINLYKNATITPQYVNYIGIDTKPVDGYRNGIELTRDIFALKGLYKIYSGEPGHRTYPLPYGDNSSPAESAYYDNPTRPEEHLGWEAETFKFLSIGEVHNGAVDVFCTVQSINGDDDRPLGIKGDYQDGNSEGQLGNAGIIRGSSQIVSVYAYDIHQNGAKFEENYVIDQYNKFQQKYYTLIPEKLSPFNDSKFIKLATANQTYVGEGQVSARTGFIYDSTNGVNVDSLAYGGMRY
jgi:hypothetical protein